MKENGEKTIQEKNKIEELGGTGGLQRWGADLSSGSGRK